MPHALMNRSATREHSCTDSIMLPGCTVSPPVQCIYVMYVHTPAHPCGRGCDTSTPQASTTVTP